MLPSERHQRFSFTRRLSVTPLSIAILVAAPLAGCTGDQDEVCISSVCTKGAACLATVDCDPGEICAVDNVDEVDGVCVSDDWCTTNGCEEFELETCYPGCTGGQACLADDELVCVDKCTEDTDCDSLCCLNVGASYKLCAPVGSALIDTHCGEQTCHIRDNCLTGNIDYVTPNTCTDPEYLYGGSFKNVCAEDIQCKWCQRRGDTVVDCFTATIQAGDTLSGESYQWCGRTNDTLGSVCVLASDPTAECIDNKTP